VNGSAGGTWWWRSRKSGIGSGSHLELQILEEVGGGSSYLGGNSTSSSIGWNGRFRYCCDFVLFSILPALVNRSRNHIFRIAQQVGITYTYLPLVPGFDYLASGSCSLDYKRREWTDTFPTFHLPHIRAAFSPDNASGGAVKYSSLTLGTLGSRRFQHYER